MHISSVFLLLVFQSVSEWQNWTALRRVCICLAGLSVGKLTPMWHFHSENWNKPYIHVKCHIAQASSYICLTFIECNMEKNNQTWLKISEAWKQDPELKPFTTWDALYSSCHDTQWASFSICQLLYMNKIYRSQVKAAVWVFLTQRLV